eukprot:768127-Hanusia_phi.AAC.2
MACSEGGTQGNIAVFHALGEEHHVLLELELARDPGRRAGLPDALEDEDGVGVEEPVGGVVVQLGAVLGGGGEDNGGLEAQDTCAQHILLLHWSAMHVEDVGKVADLLVDLPAGLRDVLVSQRLDEILNGSYLPAHEDVSLPFHLLLHRLLHDLLLRPRLRGNVERLGGPGRSGPAARLPSPLLPAACATAELT